MAGRWRSAEVGEPEEEPLASDARLCSAWMSGCPRPAVLIVSSGIMGLEVAAMFLLTSRTLSVTAEFHLGHVQQGLLMSFASLGGLAGAFVVGHVADRRGRRPPVLWSLSSMALFSAMASLAETYRALVMLGACMGLSVGCGVVPISVLLSETSREDRRLGVRGVCQAVGGLLGFAMLVAIHLDDPTMRHLHWRRLLRGLALSSTALGVLAFLCLPESASFLKAIYCGDLEAFGAWRPAGKREERTTVRSQLGLVLSRRFFFTTLYIGSAGFLFGLVQGGHQYALPQILSKESSLVSAAMGRILICVCGVPMAPAAQCTATLLSRRGALVALGLSSAVVALSAAVLGSWPAPQPAGVEMMFFVGMSFDPYRAFLCGLLLGEIGADVYPTTTTGFGASIVAGSLGVATIVAPGLFELLEVLTGTWTTFYYVLCVLLANFTAVTVFLEPKVDTYRAEEVSPKLFAPPASAQRWASMPGSRIYGAVGSCAS